MFSDPQSITVGATPHSLPATARSTDSSVYTKDDGSYLLTVAHQYKTERNRFTVRVDTKKTAADPLTSANNRVYSMSAYLVIDKPVVGYSNTEAQDLARALITWASAANLNKVLGGET